MAEEVCPWWVGYLLVSPLRRLFQKPEALLSPYVEQGMTAMDVGCAMGFFSLPLAELVGREGRVVCVDLQERMIRSLRKRAARAGLADRIEMRVCSKQSLGTGDLAGAVDFALAFAVVHEVGYSEGFEAHVITTESYGLEAQIICKMLGRIGIKAKLDVLTIPEFWGRLYLPLLKKPPEQQDWDISISFTPNTIGHMGATFFSFGLLEDSHMRWIEYDPVYEGMFKDMSRTVDPEKQKEKIQRMDEYVYDRAYRIFIYSPLTLYAVNKEVDFVPQEFVFLRLKETSVTENHWSIRGKNN